MNFLDNPIYWFPSAQGNKIKYFSKIISQKNQNWEVDILALVKDLSVLYYLL